jgi:hypothetical protein
VWRHEMWQVCRSEESGLGQFSHLFLGARFMWRGGVGIVAASEFRRRLRIDDRGLGGEAGE